MAGSCGGPMKRGFLFSIKRNQSQMTSRGRNAVRARAQPVAAGRRRIFFPVGARLLACDKGFSLTRSTSMSTLEALRFVLDDARTPEIIRHHVVDALQYALRNYGQVFTAKEVEWLAQWDDARLPLAARKELDKREPEFTAR
jgi:hypothetical protein